MFPEVKGSNLENRLFVLPYDFESQYNVVQLAFVEKQQYDVDTWLEFLRTLRDEFPMVSTYELPTLPRFPWYQRLLLDYWMRTGIPDANIRAHTITLYVDVPQFLGAMQWHDTRAIYTLLVDRQGTILWHDTGCYTPAKGAALRHTIAALTVL